MSPFEHSGALREANRLIEQALATGQNHLDLSQLNLRQLPPQLEKLSQQLTSLNVSTEA
ncbi:hypothetical protein Vspart_01372 [Vibrio spartinae]|uniref:Uncharacterized protein n=2 Tax=Vibrio spartinae TaxID=1918945 RepID=A0A1N6M7G3_9VIBR|nr:hypothetical protein Vspart_01372 [Vibrio spartinae]SIO95388.1 hypothetical protein VSP9026_03131 [Vibrio spartinae]